MATIRIPNIDESGNFLDPALLDRLRENRRGTVDPEVLANTPTQLFVRDDLGVARPDWAGPVYWLTTVVGGTPDNIEPRDQVIDVSLEPTRPLY